ncbi:MAG: hypothetical protein CM15mP65_06080 [Crocinitomicaceae bacterium]|nr:MAG: hypothetical protein CM15mP65_06080 [Crocinitomicaceae bacterium]
MFLWIKYLLATFTYQPSADNDNILIFSADNPDVECSWDFGNGTSGSGPVDTAKYPFAGSFDVTLSVFNSQGKCTKHTKYYYRFQ